MDRLSALVTGGGRGIGRAIVDRLRADGVTVTTCGRGPRPDDLADDVHWVTADLADARAADRPANEARQANGPCSYSSTTPGSRWRRPSQTAPTTTGTSSWGQLPRVYSMCRAVLPAMTEDGCVIVNVGSISASVADPSMALYNASNAFVHALRQTVRARVGWLG